MRRVPHLAEAEEGTSLFNTCGSGGRSESKRKGKNRIAIKPSLGALISFLVDNHKTGQDTGDALVTRTGSTNTPWPSANVMSRRRGPASPFDQRAIKGSSKTSPDKVFSCFLLKELLGFLCSSGASSSLVMQWALSPCRRRGRNQMSRGGREGGRRPSRGADSVAKWTTATTASSSFFSFLSSSTPSTAIPTSSLSSSHLGFLSIVPIDCCTHVYVYSLYSPIPSHFLVSLPSTSSFFPLEYRDSALPLLKTKSVSVEE